MDINEGTVVITGVEGQDGSTLADYLLDLSYKVVGVTKRSGTKDLSVNLNEAICNNNFSLEFGDIGDSSFINFIVKKYRPEMYFNLAAMSHVGQSFKEPLRCFDNNAKSVVIVLDAIRNNSKYTRFYQASTSEMFGGIDVPEEGYDESSLFHPRSPYAVAKVAAHYSVQNFREAYGLYACSGILFNHSGTRRGYDFATRKITRGIAAIKLDLANELRMGDLSAFRDEGSSKDYVKAMYLMLQQDKPEDYVIATGDGATIEDMFRYVCDLAGLEFESVYQSDPRFMRPSDVPFLRGNPAKAKTKLGWTPEYDWKKLLKEMYENDLAELQE